MEKLMQYVWQHRLWLPQAMITVDGRKIQVIDQGRLNNDAGPDFFNAKVKIDGEMWVGNIEIHVRASDWYRHHHDKDEAYDNVILHVVEKDDMPVRRANGEVIPQLVMPCSAQFSEQYHRLVGSAASELPCAQDIAKMPSIYLTDMISTLGYERLYSKVERIGELLTRFSGDWNEVCYVLLARSLGFGVNSDAFERLALATPLKMMAKHSDSLTIIEAMLFGQSGLLDSAPENDGYVSTLKGEYQFFCQKFGLKQPSSLGWKMARMRPQNFPHRRIAVLAAMIEGGFEYASKMMTAKSVEEVKALFDVKLSGYWSQRCSFNSTGGGSSRGLSESSISILIINAVIPVIYAYGRMCNDESACNRAVEMLQSLKAERNSIVELFSRAGIECKDAFTSQALIHLRRQYCETRKCLYCRIGHRMLALKARKQ
ncbi:MAG: DUF2851 family protein [Muribaculaceae bacterium]|nr:DUF2851 family protein [Muribaculaceae bacterium]